METLAYGRHLIVDGAGAHEDALRDELSVKKLLNSLAEQLEPNAKATIHVLTAEEPAGLSAGVRLPESHLSVHTFAQKQLVSLNVFSRHYMPGATMSKAIEEIFGIHESESHLSHHSRTMARDEHLLLRSLAGDRAYVFARLDSSLSPMT